MQTLSMIMLFRALIRTHHMTSRKKISAISKAAKKYECAVYLKTGSHPPGVMISESQVEGLEGLAGWVAAIKVGLSLFMYHIFWSVSRKPKRTICIFI